MSLMTFILGMTFDSNMTFEKHLRSVSRAASQRLGIKKSSMAKEPPSGESTTVECGFKYKLRAVIY